MPVLELKGRIVQVRQVAQGESIAGCLGWTARRRTRLALISVGYADGYPRPVNPADTKLAAIVGGRRCPVVGRPSMDLLPVDVTDLPDPAAARYGEMATLIGAQVGIDELAAATASSGREVLSGLGQRFHRLYYAI
jgi:alanine racemase